MTTPAIKTVIELMEALPEDKQRILVEYIKKQIQIIAPPPPDASYRKIQHVEKTHSPVKKF